MNRTVRVVSFFALMLLLLLIGAANAQVVRANVTATELFDLTAKPPVGELVSLGTVICTGGQEPTGNPLLPCPPGSRTAVRGFTVKARMTGTGENAQLITGWNVIEENENYDVNFSGRLWGKFTLTLDAGGVWEGVFTGVKTTENGQLKDTLRAVGQGSGGLIDGMQLEVTIVNTFPAPFVVAGTIQGVVLEIPRAQQ